MRVSQDSTARSLSKRAVSEFDSALSGDLIRPGDEDYDQVRSIWNGMIDRRPALIARCKVVADVIEAVRFARRHSLVVSVRGGGHGVSGNAVCEGGLMIDLSEMTATHVDTQDATVTAEAGALLGDLDRATQAFGLAVPAGTVSETGIAGLTLGGGLGWLMRKHGLTCDNLIGVDMVTADGEFLRADDDTHPELMWGLRGGGGNFGIVTSFRYQAHPVGPSVLAGFLFHPIAEAEEFLRFYQEYAAQAPDELTTIAVIRIMPPVATVPEELHGAHVVGAGVCYIGDLEEGDRVLQPFRDFGTPIHDSIQTTRFTDHQAALDAGVPAGFHYYEKAESLPDLSSELIRTLAEHGEKLTSPYAFVGLFQMGGAVSRVAEQDTAYANRGAAYSLIISSGWENPSDTDDQMNRVRSFWKAARPFSAGGAYINFMSHDDGQERVIETYGQHKYRRLADLKSIYDPTNLFRLNQNIKPTSPTADTRA
ncbi:MAG: FAD-binding oxidoreductase [Actinomycetota bacterium]